MRWGLVMVCLHCLCREVCIRPWLPTPEIMMCCFGGLVDHLHSSLFSFFLLQAQVPSRDRCTTFMLSDCACPPALHVAGWSGQLFSSVGLFLTVSTIVRTNLSELTGARLML
uniref:Putative secreted protein n=1 Tax=Ixodes ricinus TaxID=34613 RepID=A0A090XCZ1_IXORI